MGSARRQTLLLPPLLDLAQSLEPELRNQFARWSGRSRIQSTAVVGTARQLHWLLTGQTSDAPIARTLHPAARNAVFAQPVLMAPGMVDVTLERLCPDARWPTGFVADLKSVSEELELRCTVVTGGFVFESDDPINCAFTPPDLALTRPLEFSLPHGADAERWRRVLNESQILARHHGCTSFNSLWLWGAGAPGAAGADWTIHTVDPVLQTLADHIGAQRAASDAAEIVVYAPQDHPAECLLSARRVLIADGLVLEQTAFKRWNPLARSRTLQDLAGLLPQ